MLICNHCQRYLKEETKICHFCQSESVVSTGKKSPATRGLSRSAAHALRAAIVVAPLAAMACGAEEDDEPAGTGGLAASGGETSSGGTENTGGQTASGGDSEVGGMGGDPVGVPIYGGPFPDMARAKV